MGFVKCPRCELNYIQDNEDYCEICKKEMRTKFVREEEAEDLCVECNERPALPGEELCAICKRENMDAEEDDDVELIDNSLALSDVSQMDEIELEVEELPDDMEDEIDEELED